MQLNAKFEVAYSAIAEILKRKPKFGEPIFCSGCNFVMGLGKPQLHAKFEVASFSRCTNIRGETPNFGEIPYPRATFPLV